MDITLYSKTPCVPCANLKTWFKIKGISYQEEPIEDHLQKLMDMGFMAAPVVKIGGDYVSGSNISYVKEKIERHSAIAATA